MNNWKELNDQGFIPGVDETEETFKERVQFCQNLQQKLLENVQAELPFTTADQASRAICEESFLTTRNLYGITPDWVLIFFSNYQLAPWHGGCAWIFQLNAQTPTTAFLQLRSNFRSQKKYLGLYQRSELMSHELAHVGRMVYDEPKYEEVLAYRSSQAKWRRFFGPIVQSSGESLFFILTLFATLLVNLSLFSVNSFFASQLTIWLPLIPVTLFLIGLVRLIRKHTQFNLCLNQLRDLFHDNDIANHLIYRLTDHEIDQFAQSTTSQIRDYILQQKEISFRWRFIAYNYQFQTN
jgi:hypothetical protein